MIIEKLERAGLTEKEANVYLAVLELGEATIAQITKKSRVKRSTVYEMLELLKKKKLVSQVHRGKRPIFIGENPQKIIGILEESKKEMENTMPELLSIMNILDRKPKIRYFDGIEGVREVFEDTLRYPDQEILTWFPYPYINLGEDYFLDRYMPERAKRKIWARAIVPDTEANRAFSKGETERIITRTKFISGDYFQKFDIEMKLYGKAKFGIISYKEDLGIIIESQKIYDGMKAIFEGMWNNLA